MVILNDEAEKYVKLVIQKFEEDPRHPMYDHVINPPVSQPHLPKLFIWSPLEHFHFSMKCFVHKNQLQPGSWTDNLTTDKHRGNPRLIYDVGCNILLIQRLYKCNSKPYKHEIKAATLSLLERYPIVLTPHHFPFKRYMRSMVSFNMIEHIFKGILQGLGFTKMAEGFSALTYGHFQRVHGQMNESFYSNILYSVLSGDKIQNIFLDTYNDVKGTVEANNVLPASSISIDYSYQAGMSYNSGGEQKDVMKFLVLISETGQVISWKPSKADSVVNNLYCLLSDLREKLNYSTNIVKLVFTDYCCEVRDILTNLFPDVSVKKELYQILKSVNNCLPPGGGIHEQIFMKEFGLIFRQENDKGDKRELPTANPETILVNLTTFLSNKNSYIERLHLEKRKVLIELFENMKDHVIAGCLSYIPVGNGSDSIEKFHHDFDNKKLVSRFYMYSPDLAKSVFAVLVSAYNSCIKQENHISNGKLYPYLPKVTVSPLLYSPEQSDDGPFTDISLLTTANVFSTYLISKIACRVYHTYNTIKVIENCFSVNDMKFEQFVVFANKSTAKSVSVEDFSTAKNILISNMESFGLSIAEDVKPDDSVNLFSCILQDIVNLKETDEEIYEKLVNNLRFGEESDEPSKITIEKLRKACIEEIRKNQIYDGTEIKLDENLSRLEESGDFPDGFDGYIIDALTNILGLPIVVISSHSDNDISIYLPKFRQVAYRPLVLRHINVGNGCYFNATQEKKKEQDLVLQCRCRTNCRSTRCPCQKLNSSCSSKCYCRDCKNNKEKLQSNGCCCGIRDKTNQIFCSNLKSRQSRCPCLKNQIACSSQCTCKGCANEFGKKIVDEKKDKRTIKIPKRDEKSYKKQTIKESYEDTHMDADSNDSWNFQEIAALVSCIQLINLANIPVSSESVQVIYTAVRNSYPILLLGMKLRTKTVTDVFEKLQKMKFFSQIVSANNIENSERTPTSKNDSNVTKVGIKLPAFENSISENCGANVSNAEELNDRSNDVSNDQNDIEFSLVADVKSIDETLKRQLGDGENDIGPSSVVKSIKLDNPSNKTSSSDDEQNNLENFEVLLVATNDEFVMPREDC